MAANKKSQLSVLIPNRVFQVSIGEIELKPFKFSQFQIALNIIEKYIKAILIGDMPDSAKSNQEEDEEKTITTASIINFLLEKSDDDYVVLEDIAYLLKLVSGKDVEEIQELTYDEVFGLLTEVIDQNMDFFSRIGKKINPQKEQLEDSLNVAKAETTGELESEG